MIWIPCSASAWMVTGVYLLVGLGAGGADADLASGQVPGKAAAIWKPPALGLAPCQGEVRGDAGVNRLRRARLT